MSHYSIGGGGGAMDGHNIYGDPHAAHRSMGSAAPGSLTHSPSNYSGHSPTGMGAAGAGAYPSPYTSSAPSSTMQGVINSSPGDTQLKRDKDAVYG
jgi:hypothetical protein